MSAFHHFKPPTLQALLQPVMDLVQSAGNEILRIYTSDEMEMRLKEDDSPLTAADCRSHELLTTGLAALTPDIPVVSEEDTDRVTAEQVGAETFWLVDPLDGTKEFLKRTGEFTVNVALVSNREPVLGIVHAPCLRRFYYGINGKGAWRHEPSTNPQAIHTSRCDFQRIRLVASRDHAGPMVRQLSEKLRPVSFLSMGSSLKLCLVAQGAADFYPRDVPTMEWDTAAAHAVLLASGGLLLDQSGQPLRYGKSQFRNSSIFAVGDPSAAARLLEGIISG